MVFPRYRLGGVYLSSLLIFVLMCLVVLVHRINATIHVDTFVGVCVHICADIGFCVDIHIDILIDIAIGISIDNYC